MEFVVRAESVDEALRVAHAVLPGRRSDLETEDVKEINLTGPATIVARFRQE